MSKLLLVAAIAVSFVLSGEVFAQNSVQKAQELAAALDKTKHKKKEKKNISIEVYVDIRNEPAVKANPSEYSGVYRAEDSAYRLDLRVAADGSAEGSGNDRTGEESAKASFTLKDARVDGAVLTGTKVFSDGRTERFEAVFANRTISNGKNPNEIATRETAFGLGFIQSNGSWTNRVFLEAK